MKNCSNSAPFSNNNLILKFSWSKTKSNSLKEIPIKKKYTLFFVTPNQILNISILRAIIKQLCVPTDGMKKKKKNISIFIRIWKSPVNKQWFEIRKKKSTKPNRKGK